MSGFAGGGAGGGPGPGGCASEVYQGLVEMGTQAEVDARTVLGASGCPLTIAPNRLRIYVEVAPGPSLGSAAFLNHMGASGPVGMGASALDWQSSRGAATETARGDFSTAVGQNNTVVAGGTNSAAFGFNNNVQASNGSSFGANNRVDGMYGVAVGRGNNSRGPASITIGRNNATGVGYAQAVAIGDSNIVSNVAGVAIGSSSQAALDSVAIGNGAFATAGDNVAIGRRAQAINIRAIAIGWDAIGGGADAISIGSNSRAGVQGVALGRLADAGVGPNSMALGYGSTVRPARVTNITAPIFTRNDSGEPLANSDLFFSGANVLIMLPEVDISVLADYSATIAAAGNVRIWLEEVGLILTTRGAPVTTQPTVRFGIAGTPAKYLAPTLCTLLTALRLRERFNLLLVDEPETSLSFGIVAPAGVPGPASCFVRPYFRGHLVENE